jgi:branched-chain amino acid transport system permease protein
MSKYYKWKGEKLVPIISCLVLAIIPLLFKSQYLLQVMIMAFLFAYWGMSWNITCGYAGLFSLGHASFLGLGAYTSTVLFIHFELTPWIGMFVGGGVAVIAAVIIGYPCFRLRGVYFAISTLAFVSVLQMLITGTRTIGGFDLGAGEGLVIPVVGHSWHDFQFIDKSYYYWIALTMLIGVAVIAHLLKRSRIGFYLMSIKYDQEAADSLGVNIVKYKLISWCISSFLTALGGTFYAQLLLYVAPDRLLSVPLSIELVILALVGGIGTVYGPILGAFLLIPLGELLRAELGGQFAQIVTMIYGTILIVIILFLPGGIRSLLTRSK